MRGVVILALACLLAGCEGPTPPEFPRCPAQVAIPAPAPRIHGLGAIVALEEREEIARIAERARGNACAMAVEARDAWIKGHAR